MAPEVVYLTNLQEFNDALSQNELVVVDFTASWCGPCRMIAPVFKELQTEYPTIKFFKVDVDANAEASEKQGIQCMPTFHFYRKGESIAHIEGASEAKLKENLDNLKNC